MRFLLTSRADLVEGSGLTPFDEHELLAAAGPLVEMIRDEIDRLVSLWPTLIPRDLVRQTATILEA